MRGNIENGNLTSDANNTYLLNVREIDVEKIARGDMRWED